MRKFFNDDDAINITCAEIVKITKKSCYSIMRNILRKEKPNKWQEASRAISGYDSCDKSLKAIYDYVNVLIQIANQGCETSVSPEKRNVKDVKDLEHFYKNIGYKHDETGENWNGPDSADLYDAEENYKLAKKVISAI